MPQISDLESFISADDHKGFLRAYFQIIDEGTNLALPSSLELLQIREGWSEILPEIGGGYTDEFIDSLSQFWFQIVKKQGGTIGDNFAKEILALIDGKPMPKSEGPDQNTSSSGSSPANTNSPPATKKTSGGTSSQNDGADEPESSASSGLPSDKVESQISASYYQYQTAAETKFPEKDRLRKLVATAIKNQAALDFVIYHLAIERHHPKPNIPMSSVVSVIKPKWEEIFLSEYNLQIEPEFLKSVSALWFNAVNLKGLPTGIDKFNDILNHLVLQKQQRQAESKTETPLPTAEKAKPSLLSNIKSIFRSR